MGRTTATLAAGLLLVLLAGCALLPPREVPVGELVAAWSEADHEELQTDVRVERQLIQDEHSRDALLRLLPATDQTTRLAAVDLSESALVVIGYSRCTGTRLWLEGDGLLLFHLPEGEPTLCSWSPYTVEVWQLAYSAIDSTPGELRLDR